MTPFCCLNHLIATIYIHKKSKIWWTERCTNIQIKKDQLLTIKPRTNEIKKNLKILDRRLQGIKNNWEKINKMLVHFEKNKNTILEMIRAF